MTEAQEMALAQIARCSDDTPTHYSEAARAALEELRRLREAVRVHRARLEELAGPAGGAKLSEGELLKRFAALRESAPKSGTLWRHRSGGLYRVAGFTLDSRGLTGMVVYTQVATGVEFSRPLAEFLGAVPDGHGGVMPRFSPLEEGREVTGG